MLLLLNQIASSFSTSYDLTTENYRESARENYPIHSLILTRSKARSLGQAKVRFPARPSFSIDTFIFFPLAPISLALNSKEGPNRRRQKRGRSPSSLHGNASEDFISDQHLVLLLQALNSTPSHHVMNEGFIFFRKCGVTSVGK